MAASNIYLQLITATGPVVGEGLLEGFEGSIELKKFGWSLEAKIDALPLGSLASRFTPGAALKALGVGSTIAMETGLITFEKRFDVASSQIHFCIDNKLKVVSASITVLHIKQKGRAIHEPGFVLTATDGYFQDATIKAGADGDMTEVNETVKLKARYFTMTYLKRAGKDNVPTAPFIWDAGTGS